MNRTPIEWTDYTANPLKYRTADGRVVWACEKVSAGCTNCYAEALSHRYGGVRRAGDWNAVTMAGLTPFLDEAELRRMLTLKAARGKRVFVGDMTDVFGEWVTEDLLNDIFAVMALRRSVTWQVLTKRADRMRAYFADGARRDAVIRRMITLAGDFDGRPEGGWLQEAFIVEELFAKGHLWPLPNVWLGVSAENQAMAAERIPSLLQTPAAVRFVSAEPLLEPVDLGLNETTCPCCTGFQFSSRWVQVLRPVVADFPMALLPENRGLVAEPGIVLGRMNPHGALSVPTPNGRFLGVRPGEVETLPKLDWVIVGGESGPAARTCGVEWIGSVVGQCQAAKVPVFVKQLGSASLDWSKAEPTGDFRTNPETGRRQIKLSQPRLVSGKGGDPAEWPIDLRVREFPEGRA